MKVERPRGTRDFKVGETRVRDAAERRITEVFESYSYGRIVTPVFEHAELFQIKSGDEIREHMYVFKDKSDRLLCLRPEETASVARMFVNELKNERKPLKLYYSDRMFRYERPQRGRYREFWQTGVELIGSDRPASDAEIIVLASKCLQALGLEFTLEIGHVGILKALLDDLKIKSEDHGRVFTLIDKGDVESLKDIVKEKRFVEVIGLKGDVEALKKAAELLDGSGGTASALRNLEEITSFAKAAGIDFRINLGIARGLEYYTGMVFEIRVDGLGAENQICGGGRYDNLIEVFGGPKTPAVGFAFGFDRVVNALELQNKVKADRRKLICVTAVSAEEMAESFRIAANLREKLRGFSVDFEFSGKSLSKTLEIASNQGADYVVIVGRKELDSGEVTVRNMTDRSQENVKLDELAEFFG
ncbi:MAG: histidine--tRNA ligase [Candidatus Altiarchaeota archaeon]